jgi:hypothetical protein
VAPPFTLSGIDNCYWIVSGRVYRGVPAVVTSGAAGDPATFAVTSRTMPAVGRLNTSLAKPS